MGRKEETDNQHFAGERSFWGYYSSASEKMNCQRNFGGGIFHWNKCIDVRSSRVSDVFGFNSSSRATPTLLDWTIRRTRHSMDGRTRGAPLVSQKFSNCPPHVTERRSSFFWLVPEVDCAPLLLRTQLRLFLTLLCATLLLPALTDYMPNTYRFHMSTTVSGRPIPRHASQSIILHALAANDFLEGYSAANRPSFQFESVQNSFGSIHPLHSSAGHDIASPAQSYSFPWQSVNIGVAQHGRKLADSNPEEPAEGVTEGKHGASPRPVLRPLVLPSPVSNPAHRRDSAPHVVTGVSPERYTDNGRSPSSSLPHDNPHLSAKPPRRCASFSDTPPPPKGQGSPAPCPLPYRGHPHRRVRNALPWDVKKAHSPSMTGLTFQRENGAADSGPRALLHDKPHSVADSLWSDVSATEESAFNEMEEKKQKSSSVGRASGSRGWPRPDTRQMGEYGARAFGRARAASLTEQGAPIIIRRNRSSPGPKKRRSTEPETSLRRSSSRPQPVQPSVDTLFSPPAGYPSLRDERSSVAGRSPGSFSLPSRGGGTAENVRNQTAAGPRGEDIAPHFRYNSEPSRLTAEEAERSRVPYVTPPAGAVEASSSGKDTPAAAEPTDMNADSESGDDDAELASMGGAPMSSRGSMSQSDDDGSGDLTAESRPSTPGGDPGGGDQNACPGDIINLMFDVYYNYLMQDPRLRRQFALLVLSSIQWPLYTDSTSWRRPLLQKWFSQLTALANETLLREMDYTYSTILLDELRELGWIIRSVDDFQRFLRAQSRVDLHLRQMLSYIPEHRFAISLKPELLEEVYNATAQLQFIYFYSSAMKNPEASSLLQWKFIREVHLRWSMLQLLGITHQLITRKPLLGVLILQVDKIDTKEEEVLRLFAAEENKATQEALLKFETTVTDALTRRIQMVAKHFQKVFSASHLNYSPGFQLPKCQVTAFYLKPEGRGRETSSLEPAENEEGSIDAGSAFSGEFDAIETGLFGFEIDINIAKELKDRLPRGSLYIQLSLVDGWDYQPVYMPPLEDPSIIPAHRATQILKANLEHDPSLFNVGLTKVIYTTILDAYNTSAPNQTGYDNDRHLVLRVPLSEFKTEELFLASIVAMVSVPSIHNAAPRTVNPHRVKVMGSARRLSQGEVLKTNSFLSGIDYRRHKSIEVMIEPNTVAVHIFLEGIKEKGANSVFELEASTIFDRLLRRGRSKFTVMHAELVPKKTGTSGQGKAVSQRVGGYPAWVLVLSNLCVAAFFLVVLVSLLLNRHAKLPWWIACICGPQNPFAPESENRRDSVAEPADHIASMSDRRAMFFARSRSMLVSGVGRRKVDKWEGDHQTKSTDGGVDGDDSGSEYHHPVGSSRHSSLLRQGSKRLSFAAAVAPISRKGSAFFGIGRGVQGRQQTNQLPTVSFDELEPYVAKTPVSSTVSSLCAVSAPTMDRSTSTGSSIRGTHSSSVCTHDRSNRNMRGSAGGVYQHRDRSLPPTERRSQGSGPMPPGSMSSTAPLRVLELAKSYRRGRRPPQLITPPHHLPTHSNGRRGSVSFKRGSAADPAARNKDGTAPQRRKARRVDEGRTRLTVSDNAKTGENVQHPYPSIRTDGSASMTTSPPVGVDELCRVTAPSGDGRGPGGIV